MISKFKNRMLNNLWDFLDEIEADNEWGFNFVTDLMERDEASEEKPKLTDKQFAKLHAIHERYMLR